MLKLETIDDVIDVFYSLDFYMFNFKRQTFLQEDVLGFYV